jgi:hypothetical protein|tara:strand:+ start:7880 stop:8803 length:924 start_codon:yes stop_codon:yes gene_type:complete
MNHSDEFIKLLEAKMRQVVEEEAHYADIESMIPKIFGSGKSDRAFEEYMAISGVRDAYAWSGKFITQKQYPGYTSKVIFQRFANRLEIDPALIEDKQYPVMMQQARDLRNSYDRKKEKMGVNIFANATSAAFDFQESEEGLSWANSAHTTKVPSVSTTSGFSNTGTSALDPTSLAAARISLQRLRDSMGNLIGSRDKLAIVAPITLSDTINEIIGTDKGLYTDEGTINVHKGQYSSIPWVLLDETSTTDWSLIRVNQTKRDLLWFDRIEPKYLVHIDKDTLSNVHSIHGRFGYLFKDWRWGYHNNVS